MQDFSDPDLLAMRRKRFPFAWVLVILLLIGGGTFAGGVYLPLFKAHKALADKHTTLAKDARSLADELARKQDELKSLEQERNKLQGTVAANDERMKSAEQRGSALQEQLETALAKRIKQRSASVAQLNDTVVVRIPSNVLFTPNSTSVTRNGAALLCEVAAVMAPGETAITVAAHSGSAEVGSAALAKTYPTVWELTGGQAGAAASLLETQCKFAAARVTAAARGNAQPIEGASAAQNTRVELVVKL